MAQDSNFLAEEVKKQGEGENTMYDLVFDPVTGEFKQELKTSSHSNGEVVTSMTEEGFAL